MSLPATNSVMKRDAKRLANSRKLATHAAGQAARFKRENGWPVCPHARRGASNFSGRWPGGSFAAEPLRVRRCSASDGKAA